MSTFLTIIIPAYNEAQTLGAVLEQIRTAQPDAEILVVDDGSTDDTARVAEAAGARVLQHPYNKGNGASVKTGLRAARGEVVVIMDADGQHDPADLARLLEPLGAYDLVVGARDARSETSIPRRLYHLALNLFAAYISGYPVPDATSGLRAAKRHLLAQFIHLLPNGFSTPVTSTLAFYKAGYSVKFVPVTMPKRAGGKSKINPLNDGLRFILIVFRTITIFSPLKVFLPTSLLFIAVALVYTIIDMLFIAGRLHIANTSVLLITMGIVIFLIGLVSEQIAALRFDRAEAGQ
jgi:glycosyltransferase involved in cell wall biosynthesis